MEIKLRNNGKVTILDLQGNLTIGASEEAFGEMVAQLLKENQKNLLVNMAGVPFIDSSGIGGLIKSFSRVKSDGGKLKLLQPSPNARQLLSITGLLSVLEVFDDEASAISSF